MVKDTGKADGASRIRPLNVPQPIEVKADERGWPVAVHLGRRWLTAQVVDRWRIDDEWWRERGVVRVYYLVLAESGRLVTMYNDLGCNDWWRQEYQ